VGSIVQVNQQEVAPHLQRSVVQRLVCGRYTATLWAVPWTVAAAQLVARRRDRHSLRAGCCDAPCAWFHLGDCLQGSQGARDSSSLKL
jgi:hypothetical protein